MYFAILTYAFVTNKPVGIPDAWPAETIELGESTTLPGEDWVLMTSQELTDYMEDNKSAYDSWAINNRLLENKYLRIIQIDNKTSSIISRGFEFDSHRFSLSLAAQINWSGLVTLENLLTWPMTITTIDDNEYSLSQANLLYFIGTGKTIIVSAIDSGRTLKIAISQATTQAELDAIVDSR